ncbi:MAG: hypothetical protein IKP06_06500 [Elusimicrobiaceae bacterium]|nr:hypothetical protein [Elusimicrobiaceae bacterium]
MRFVFLLSGILLLAGCGAVRPTQPCSINGQDCWHVAQLLENTKRIPIEPSSTEQADQRRPTAMYKNPDLTALGIKVVAGELFQDGGSTTYMLEGGIAIHTNRSISAKNAQYGFVTVLFAQGPKYVFNASGKLVEFSPEHE